MLQTFILKIFFYIPIWFLKIIFYRKRTVIRGHQFDAQSAALLSMLPKKDLSELLDGEIAKTRITLEEARIQNKVSLTPSMQVRKENHILSRHELILREYKPFQENSKKVILYFHGGGYVLNSVNTHDDMVSYMSDEIGVKFYSLDYRLSPENKYPDSLDDALDAFSWLIDQGYGPGDISVCGDSAGAHLAASLCHYLAEQNKDLPSSQLLIYPMCDPSCSSESYNLLSSGYLLTKKTMIWFWDKFRNSEENNNDSAFNLLKFNFEKTLPPTIIVTGG
ncbi:alpha/beta hydrolase, partial [Gammaproteobacteria bacterium]|nr:alpha/beta hydrolase [Gammaproteobacteria bacterium]